ncbi:MAG TPA: hypothetical protein VNO21_21865, partial [Polyangiaceae bacterium]|nr:hypothetical protein [Polyangiaceae bacterium]
MRFSYYSTVTILLAAFGCGAIGDTSDPAAASSTALLAPAAAIAVSSVSAGYSYSCALTPHGAVRCWGYNLDGELGNSSQTDSASPVTVAALDFGLTSVSSGEQHSCAVVSGGAKCWGDNSVGQLGSAPPLPTDRVPQDVTGLTSGVASVAAGRSHTCAVTSAGGVKCWG